jgi:hypothetical protein
LFGGVGAPPEPAVLAFVLVPVNPAPPLLLVPVPVVVVAGDVPVPVAVVVVGDVFVGVVSVGVVFVGVVVVGVVTVFAFGVVGVVGTEAVCWARQSAPARAASCELACLRLFWSAAATPLRFETELSKPCAALAAAWHWPLSMFDATVFSWSFKSVASLAESRPEPPPQAATRTATAKPSTPGRSAREI